MVPIWRRPTVRAFVTPTRERRFRLLFFLPWCASFFLLACASGGSGANSTGSVTVSVTPATLSVRAGDPAQQFSDTVSGTSNIAVTWSVSGIAGGNATVGIITNAGLYMPPAALPAPNTFMVSAASQASPSAQGSSNVTVMNPIPAMTSISPGTIGQGQFTIVVTGSNFVSGAVVMFGTTALATTFNSSTQLTATGTATPSQAGNVVVKVQNPAPGASTSTTSRTAIVLNGAQVNTPAATVRLLEQTTFGPTPALVTQLQQINFTTYLSDQFSAPASTYPDPTATDALTPTQQKFFANAIGNIDQLRQRVAFALSEIWVTSGTTILPQGMARYMGLLNQDAFANYRTIMQDVTLSPAMGLYLNMVNNDKPNAAANTHANENYARELLQLFTVGLYMLNSDATLQKDGSSNPIPTYDQNAVQAFARAFTGWTYPTQPGSTLQIHNPVYWFGPMEALDSNHDTASKTLLAASSVSSTLPAGQTAAQDLKGALDNIFNHPNVGPFVAKQLIEHLVSSNPSPAYVQRVASVFASGKFNGFGSGARGDMQAVIAAILLDSEARRGDDSTTVVATDGHLREPILAITSLLRAFGANTDGLGPVNFATSLTEPPLRSPSVFNFFPPDYLIPGSTLLGPEYALQTTATALARINFVNSFVYGSIGTGTTVDFTSYATLATGNDPSPVLDSLNALLLHGTMSASVHTSVLAAITAVPSGASQPLNRAKAAIYTIASSSQYQVQH